MKQSTVNLFHTLLTVIFMSGLIGLAVAIYKTYPIFPNFLDVAWLIISSLYLGWRTKLLSPLVWMTYLISITLSVFLNLR